MLSPTHVDPQHNDEPLEDIVEMYHERRNLNANLLRLLLAREVTMQELDESESTFVRTFSYHYAFINIDRDALPRAEFKKDASKCQESKVTVYLIPNTLHRGELWLKHTLITGEENKTPWSLTFVFSVGKNHIVAGREVRETSEELTSYLKQAGYKHFPSINSLKKRTYTNYKQKFTRKDAEFLFCVSEMGPCLYYQHATLKFSPETEQESRDLMAQQLMKELQLFPGRSDVLECLRIFYPDEYEQIKKLGYEGKIPVECYPVRNYFSTDQEEEEADEEDDFYDIRYIPSDMKDCNLVILKEKYDI